MTPFNLQTALARAGCLLGADYGAALPDGPALVSAAELTVFFAAPFLAAGRTVFLADGWALVAGLAVDFAGRLAVDLAAAPALFI